MSRPVKNRVSSAVAVLLSVCAVQAVADPVVVYLPSGTVDGLGPQQYDQGSAYSVSLLEDQRLAGRMPGNPTTTFSPAGGSGQLGVLVYSHAQTQTYNTNFGFANSLPSVTGNVTSAGGLWTGGTVGSLRNYLNTLAGVPNTLQPLFVFDHNENSGGANLFLSANVTVGGRGFSFDSSANNTFNATDYVLSCGDVSIGPSPNPTASCAIAAATTSNTTYSWRTNGSGALDYFGIFADLDIWSNQYSNSDLFQVEFNLRDLDAGFEELSIGGYNFHRPTTDVPEPGSMALFGLGLLALSWVGRRRVKKSD